MTADAAKTREDALKLTARDREIAKRVAEINSGSVKLVPWDEVRRRLAEIRR